MTITIDNIPDQKKAEYQRFFTTLVREYDLDELEDKLLGFHMSANDTSTFPISHLKAKYAR